jgi:hypothetical protein
MDKISVATTIVTIKKLVATTLATGENLNCKHICN